MATISDELAASIQKCFDRTYVDLANQQQFLFGAGNVTITKPDGTTGTVKSWAQFLNEYGERQTAIDIAVKDVAKTTMDNSWTKAQTFKDASTFEKGVSIAGEVNISQKLHLKNGLELYHTTPYIDFHYGNSTTDFTHRLIASNANTLECSSSYKVNGNIVVNGAAQLDGDITTFGQVTLRANKWWGFVAQRSDEGNPSVGDTITCPNFTSRMAARGGDTNNPFGAGSMWFEEYVGTSHRMVISVQGFSQPTQYWQFLVGGNIYNSANGYVQYQGTSDARLKHDIKPTDGQLSVERIRALELVTFIYKDDEQNRTRRGIIAQQAQEVDPQYVKKVNTAYMRNGERVNDDRLQLDNNVIMMDTLAAVKVLIKRVDELEEKLSSLEIH